MDSPEKNGGNSEEENSWREAAGRGENMAPETSSLTKANNTGSWEDTKHLESFSVCLLHN